MANWYGAARTNYVLVDRPALEAALFAWPDISIEDHGDGDDSDRVCILANTEYGDFPSWTEDDEGNEVEFTIEDVVMPHVQEGQVLVAMSAGHEKLRYVTGYASAYVRRNGAVEVTSVSLNDIYPRAAAEFGIDQSLITPATY